MPRVVGPLESYSVLVPEASNTFDPEQHRTVYSTLGLRIEVLKDGGPKVNGGFGEETRVWEDVGTSTR